MNTPLLTKNPARICLVIAQDLKERVGMIEVVGLQSHDLKEISADLNILRELLLDILAQG